jgi:hypothetical protein
MKFSWLHFFHHIRRILMCMSAWRLRWGRRVPLFDHTEFMLNRVFIGQHHTSYFLGGHFAAITLPVSSLRVPEGRNAFVLRIDLLLSLSKRSCAITKPHVHSPGERQANTTRHRCGLDEFSTSASATSKFSNPEPFGSITVYLNKNLSTILKYYVHVI